MRPLGDRLQSIHRNGSEVRGDHQIFLERAASSLAASVMESSQMLKSVGSQSKPSKAYDVARSGLGVVAPAQLQLQPHQISQAAPKYRGSARELFAALQTSQSGLAALPVKGERQSSSSRSPSPRATSAAGNSATAEGNSPRMVSVKDFQRGAPLVAPAQLLPFPGDGNSPGRRRRLAEMTGGRSNILDPARGVPRQQKEREDLADGVTAMIFPVQCEIGPLKTTPVAECSSFDVLLERLVEHPESCLADPLALFRAPVCAPAPHMPGLPGRLLGEKSLRAVPTVVQHTPEDLRVLLDDLPCRSPPAACGASSWATPSAALSLAQQFAGEFAAVSAPFQYALAARAGAESLARGVRLATELDPRTSVLSIRGGLRSFTITSPGPACCKACKTNGSRPSFRTSRSFKAAEKAEPPAKIETSAEDYALLQQLKEQKVQPDRQSSSERQ
ncbi:unnamed protein product [Durusdinium trenchii]|uniref:Uncharacterized protein n=1 Tax=Durusdinium trenchii TaxID=1381693 RepID=A0ABP0SXS2_9DINO